MTMLPPQRKGSPVVPAPLAPPWAEAAAAAFTAAASEDMVSAAAILQNMVDTHGSEIVIDVMVAWINATIRHAGIRQVGPGEDRAITLDGFVSSVDGSTYDTAAVPAEVRWAGRLMTARASNDSKTFAALINEAPDDPEVWGRYVLTLLNCCAMTTVHAHRFPDSFPNA